MNNYYSWSGDSRHLLTGILLGFALGSPAFADDTEVLVGNQLNPGNPNILFIIDTSGSMESDVVVGRDYNPQTVYTGNCDVERFYWTLEGTGTITLPDCAFNTFVNKSAYKCQAGQTVIDESGQFRDRHAQWDESLEPNSWTEVARASSDPSLGGSNRLTECAADEGLHGDVAGDFYPADGDDGPWSTDENEGIDWPTSGELYTFFSGNYLNWIQQRGADTTVASRMKVVQSAVREVLSPLNDINIGLMRFSANAEGGMVLHEMAPIEDSLEDILTEVDALQPLGGTPVTETLYESGQYYAGRTVDFGVNSTGNGGVAQPSVDTSQNAQGNYISPILRQCQRNYVVLLTDGLPTGDTDADQRIQRLPDFDASCDGSCLDELAKYLDTVDQRTGGNLPDDQTVQTFTIGFHTDQDLLRNAATGQVMVVDEDGNPVLDDNDNPVMRPGYFIANDQQQLADAFQGIIDSILSIGETYTAPALSVDVQNRLTNRQDLFFAMFEPPSRGEPHWDGNLKKYRIGRAASAAPDSTPTIIDANNRVAVDANGLFLEGSRSFWSSTVDEGDVPVGGFVDTLTTSRNIYTNISGSSLTAGINQVHESNTGLTAEMLGVDPDQRESLIKWARGLDTDGTSPRKVIGDPLHSAPTLIAYANDRFALFFGTNDGFLHALDPESDSVTTNIEHFAFIPKELLPQLAELRRNLPQPQYSAEKAYGLDGPITVWIDESDNDGVVEGSERAYIYVGMRRGGRNYYALDVTDVNNPQLKWSIIGGTGQFAELGQTWSAAIPSRIMWGGAERQVLFFAGGNDENQDSRNRPSQADDMGRAIYMVDALTGTRLWWASIDSGADLTLDDMTHSIPSNLRVIDSNQDGFDDRIYVGDTAAKVWRFDIDNVDSSITGGVFADLGGANEIGNRRIYSPPSVTRVFDEHLGTFLTVSVGTGHRAHPLEYDVADGFFMMQDPDVFAPYVNPSTQQVQYRDPIEIADLLDVSLNVEPAIADLDSSKGWFIDFDDGEKSLSAPLTVLDRIFFTTYLPAPPALSCQPEPVLGSGRLYTVNLLTGAPIYADSPVPNPAPDDRFTPLDASGIPAGPTLVFTPPNCDDCDADDPVSEITMLIGTQAINPQINNVPVQTYWVQEDIDR